MNNAIAIKACLDRINEGSLKCFEIQKQQQKDERKNRTNTKPKMRERDTSEERPYAARIGQTMMSLPRQRKGHFKNRLGHHETMDGLIILLKDRKERELFQGVRIFTEIIVQTLQLF